MIVVREIGLADLWAFLRAKNAPLPGAVYKQIVEAVAVGGVYGGFVADAPVAIGALARFGEGSRVAWISVIPAAAVAPLAVVRAVRARLVDCADVVALVDDADQKAQRFVRLCGFRPSERVLDGHRIWTHGGRAHRQDGEEAICPRGGGEPASGAAHR